MEQVIITLDDDVQAGATSPTQAVALLTKVTKEAANAKRGRDPEPGMVRVFAMETSPRGLASEYTQGSSRGCRSLVLALRHDRNTHDLAIKTCKHLHPEAAV